MNVLAVETTGPGRAAIAVIEVTGEGARELVASCFDRPFPAAGETAYGRVVSGGRAVDEVVVRLLSEGFTGEETVEIHAHGGKVTRKEILETLQSLGARIGDRQDLLDRACDRGRIDPVQREAWELLPKALTRLAARVLLDQANGALSRAIREDRADVATAPLGLALARPRRIVLAGRPNAGKSSLFNALLQEDRVIVSEEAGTTRDPVEEWVAFEGVPFRLCDTAGMEGETFQGALHEAARERSEERMQQADLILLLDDGSGKTPSLPEGGPVLKLASKADLGKGGAGLPVSARTGEGLKALRREVLSTLGVVPLHEAGSAVVFTDRQRRLIGEGRGGRCCQEGRGMSGEG